MPKLDHMLALEDFEAAARSRLPRSIHAFAAAGSEGGLTVAGNREAFRRTRILPRMFRNVAARTTRTTLFGREWAAPFGIAPMGLTAAARFDGDLILARSAQAANLPFILSGASSIPIEEVMRATPESWFQVYLTGHPEIDAAMTDRFVAAGVKVLVITADTPVAPSRELSIRSGGLNLPLRLNSRLVVDVLLHPGWIGTTLLPTLTRRGIPRFVNAGIGPASRWIDANPGGPGAARDKLHWDDIARIRERWPGKLVIKGLLAPDDASEARRIGADGVIVSNHGGRQLDGTVATLDALPGIAAVAGDMAVMLDGGVRRGGDIVRALALGASFVFVGRPMLYAAAAFGEAGVHHALALLETEFARALALAGCRDPGSIDHSLLG